MHKDFFSFLSKTCTSEVYYVILVNKILGDFVIKKAISANPFD